MATYIPNALDATEPREDKLVESAALEFRRLKTSITDRVATVQQAVATEAVDRNIADAALDGRITALEQTVISSGLPGAVVISSHVATAGQTIFTLLLDPIAYVTVDVFINGIRQALNTYTVTGGALPFITLSEPAEVGWQVEIKSTVPVAVGVTDAALVRYTDPITGVSNVQTSLDTAKAAITGNTAAIAANVAAKDASGGYPGLTLFKLNLRNAVNTFTSWFTTAATASRTWTMPDKDGTVAMTNDIQDAASKSTPIDADKLGVVDSAASNILKQLSWANVKATLKTYFDTLYALRAGSAAQIFAVNGALLGATSDIYLYESSPGVLTIRHGTVAGGQKFSSFTAAGGLDLLSGGLTISNPSLLGYGTGAGGSVVQATNKSTAVTLNKPCGQITMNNAALAAGASVTFALNNNLLTPLDSFIVNIAGAASGGNDYRLNTYTGNTGQALITITNLTAGPLSNALVINFAAIKGTAS